MKSENSDRKEENAKRCNAVAKKIKSGMERVCACVLNVIFPKDITCDVCGGELIADTDYRLCSKCTENMPFNVGKVCLICGEPIHNEADYCIRCQNSEINFKINRSSLIYDGIARKLVLALKFGRKKYIAETLGAMMANTFIEKQMEADIIVPVPMSVNEKKKRGFNQAELLADEIGFRLKLPVLPALVKNRDTSQQKALSAAGRSENLKGAFACVFTEVYGRKILLVDDVFTTGATANECAKVLNKARARDVSVLTAAITPQKIFME